MNIFSKTNLAVVLGFIMGTMSLAGVARVSGVPFCAIINICDENILQVTKDLIKEAEENQEKINKLNNEKTILVNEVASLLLEEKKNTENINAVINDIEALNISGENDDVALQKISNALIKVSSDLYNITDK